MAAYGEPDWASPGNTANSATVNSATPGSVTVSGGGGQNTDTGAALSRARCFIVLLSIFNCGLAALMATLGILSLIKFKPRGISELSQGFLAAYMVIFAALLFLYEIIWWHQLGNLNKSFRRNFGFMYGLKGKGFFLVFVSFLCLGMKNQNTSGIRGLDWVTFFVWLAAGCFSVFLSCTWPEANRAYRPPTVGLSAEDTNGQNPV